MSLGPSADTQNFKIEEMDLNFSFDLKLITDFTAHYNLLFDKRLVEYTIGLFDEQDNLIGTGSYASRTLKYIVVDSKHRESNAFATIATHLIDKVLEKHRHIFVYTHPNNISIFQGLGFKLVAKALPLFCMLEFGVASIKDYVHYLETERVANQNNQRVASIVMNCNPFTLGHKYLIEKAASENDILYVIVVEEDLSVFPFSIRWKLIKEGISHLKNVVMIKGSQYVVSGATFPCYFLKDQAFNAIIANQAELDVKIFAKYIVNALGLTHRYVGSELNCMTTAAYNKAMQKILPDYGVEVVEIDRVKVKINDNNMYVSASQVRQAIKDNNIDLLKESLPPHTYNFLTSEEAKPIVAKIKQIEAYGLE